MNIYQDEPHQNVFCMDAKSFYASVECIERNLDPMSTMLVVMSGNLEDGGGLVLAASPRAKKELGISNVSRSANIPNCPELLIVPPRMKLYIQYHMKILNIFRKYMADEDICVYSIDEQFGDLTKSWKLFGSSPQEVAKKIQQEIFDTLGIYITIGLSVNPLMAKVAMDIEAKKNQNLFAQWSYEDIPKKLWPIRLCKVCGIGSRMEKRLNSLNIKTMGDLAHYDPYLLKRQFGIMGLQYYMHAWGIDRSVISQKADYTPQSKSIGNSQVLQKKYVSKEAILTVLSEICEQVCQRLRKAEVQGATLHIYMGYAYYGGPSRDGFAHQMKIPPTNQSKVISNYAQLIFEKYWDGSAIRNIGVTMSSLQPAGTLQLNLFENPEKTIKEDMIDDVISKIRNRYSFTAIVKAHSLLKGGTAISRSGLVGGHAGGMDGMDGLD